MLVSPTGLPGTIEAVNEPIPESPSAAPLAEAEVSSTEVLISTQEVLFSTAAAAGVPRETIGRQFLTRLKRIDARARQKLAADRLSGFEIQTNEKCYHL